ncbi:MAG: glucose-1-phosphate thymidylyltransferase [Anaerolineae bacterium]|nr:glucose-1-phosphate thymidylyltransferase [Anaerolineae bacterium]NUQ03277.1 glucose-1-phosphate thymidylyltransferase [Anaerolineae bacterium]
MKGLILSGGKGTRLYPLTYTRAKQLIPVANKPVLVRVIETIRDAGVDEIGIVIGQTGPEIREAIGDGSRFGVHITYIEQPSPDGLAHAVKISQDFLGDEPFVMFLGDNVIEGGISALIRDFTSHQWNSQIVLKRVPDPRSFGVAVLKSDQSIEYLVEKPQTPPSDLALIGIYMFDSTVFQAVNTIKPSRRGEYEITDAIQWLIDHGSHVHAHVHDGWWIDTGKPIDMIEANCNVLDELTPGIAEDTVIEHSQIDRRVKIERGARIINSIVHGPTIIGEDTLLENCYVGPYSSIYHHVTLANCEVERSIILENCTIRDTEARLHDCLIGRNVMLQRKLEKPRTLTLNLADNSTLWLV